MRALEEADRAASKITRAISRHSRRLTRRGTERGLKVGISDKLADPVDNEASMTLFILPSVDALFDLSVEGLTYKLTGPAKLTSLLEDATDGEALEGTISPLTTVTVPDAVKSSVSIPLAASWFAFLYPIKGLAPKRTLRSNDAAFGFLLGGFLYFDANRSLVGFNALAIKPSPVSLSFKGPFDGEPAFTQILESSGRLANVAIAELRSSG